MYKIRFELGNQNQITYEGFAQYYSIGKIDKNIELFRDSKTIDRMNIDELNFLSKELGKSLANMVHEYSKMESTFDWNGKDPITAWFHVRTNKKEFVNDHSLSLGPFDFKQTETWMQKSYSQKYACIGHVFGYAKIFLSLVRDDGKFFDSCDEFHIGQDRTIEQINGGFGNFCSWLHVFFGQDDVVRIYGSGETA